MNTGRYIVLEELGSTQMAAEDSKAKAHRWWDGYHMGIVGCLATATFVLLLNCCLTIAVAAKHDLNDGYGILQQGDCDETKRLDLWLHLLINILSTLLLGASNYGMQCLSAPTREEVDVAHSEGRWLDIGVPSIKNLASIAPYRRILWVLLLLSSIPLHLLYNSVIFASTSYAQWTAFAVSPNFISGAPYSVGHSVTTGSPGDNVTAMLGHMRDSKTLVRLSNGDCLNAYSPALENAWSSVLIVTKREHPNNSFWNSLATNGASVAGDWIFCAMLPLDQRAGCGSKQPINPDNWSLYADGSPHVDHCLAMPANQHCQTRFSLTLMIVVIVCNCIKIICIGTLAWMMDSRPLVTLGDALSSLLQRPGT